MLKRENTKSKKFIIIISVKQYTAAQLVHRQKMSVGLQNTIFKLWTESTAK